MTTQQNPAGNQASSPYLRAAQAAERYGIGRSTFWLYVKEGKLPQPISFGPRLRLWRTDELDQAFEQGVGRASTRPS